MGSSCNLDLISGFYTMETMFSMKNIKNSLFLGVLSVVALSSCVNENVDLNGKEMGALELSVDLVQPKTRAVSEVDDYPVVIKDAEGKQIQAWDAVSDVPSKITMGVGNYTVESHTPGTLKKKMTYPYYKGTKDVEVVKGLTSAVEVLCKMQNSPISVSYDQDFRDVFASWNITVDDGEGTALSFTNTTSSTPVYWWFGEEGAKELTVNFRGTTKEGSTVVARNTLTKDQADESYSDDRPNFVGGDALTLNFKPTESTDGKISAVSINANVTFTETNEVINVVVIDKTSMDDPGDNPGGGDEPGGDDKITLTIPDPVTLTAETSMTADPSSGDVVISAESGLKSVMVKVISTSEDMIGALEGVTEDYPNVDLVNGCEVVENQELVAFLGSVGKEITVPTKGDKNYTFPVGQFYAFLGILTGSHNFVMTITDMEGNTKTGTVKITITE